MDTVQQPKKSTYPILMSGLLIGSRSISMLWAEEGRTGVDGTAAGVAEGVADGVECVVDGRLLGPEGVPGAPVSLKLVLYNLLEIRIKISSRHNSSLFISSAIHYFRRDPSYK